MGQVTSLLDREVYVMNQVDTTSVPRGLSPASARDDVLEAVSVSNSARRPLVTELAAPGRTRFGTVLRTPRLGLRPYQSVGVPQARHRGSRKGDPRREPEAPRAPIGDRFENSEHSATHLGDVAAMQGFQQWAFRQNFDHRTRRRVGRPPNRRIGSVGTWACHGHHPVRRLRPAQWLYSIRRAPQVAFSVNPLSGVIPASLEIDIDSRPPRHLSCIRSTVVVHGDSIGRASAAPQPRLGP